MNLFMADFKKIMRLSKRIADAILKEKRIEEDDWGGHFDQKNRDYIYNRLTDSEALEQREDLRNEFENSKERAWAELRERSRPTRRIHLPIFIAKIAAIFIFLLGLGFLYTSYMKDQTKELPVDGNVITLIMDDGTVKIINTEKEEELLNAKGQIVGEQEKGTLNYMRAALPEELVYNEIKVPYGKTIKLLLSDGTHVQLNAGTSMRYPIKFIKGNERHVFLEGEAFFVVAKDSLHPFRVQMGDLEVKVLGTRFNVASYAGEPEIKTVLVEGSVALYDAESPQETLLTPGHLATWDKEDKKILITEADVERCTAWTKGGLIFRGMAFGDMIKKLERAYNVSITCTNQELNNEIFSANFHVEIESIEQVLDYIKLQYPFDYTIENQRININ